jgi:hypothetical protein
MYGLKALLELWDRANRSTGDIAACQCKCFSVWCRTCCLSLPEEFGRYEVEAFTEHASRQDDVNGYFAAKGPEAPNGLPERQAQLLEDE